MKPTQVSASALSYAILFVLLLSLIAGALLSVFSAFNRQSLVFQTNENLFLDNKAALQYARITADWHGDSTQLIHNSGDTSTILKKQWGLFPIYAIRTRKGNQSISGLYMTACQSSSKIPSLVVFGSSEGLKITGKTVLEGTIYLPNGKIERAYIAGKNFEFNELHKGNLSETKNHTWKLKDLVDPSQISLGSFEEKIYSGQPIEQSFFDKTLLFSGNNTAIQSAVSGNVVFHYTDSVYIEASAKLENICIYAPYIRVKRGFKGNLQLFATEKIILEDSVSLNYPSSIYLKGSDILNDGCKIEIGEKSKVIGGIVLTSSNFDFRKPPRLIIKAQSKVGGLVYNVGTTELYGAIFGHIYTGQFECHVAGGVYTNHLVDATISSWDTPTRFGIPNILDYQDRLPTSIVSCRYKK